MSDQDDDRDEHDYEMRPTQFGRVLDIHSRADQRDGSSLSRHGDAIRWGSREEFVVSAVNQLSWSSQLIRVQRDSPYPCNWQMIGTLTVPTDWAASAIATGEWIAALEILLGTGQSRSRHLINLRALIDLAVPPALLATGQAWYFPDQNSVQTTYPWVMSGGLVGTTVSMRALVVLTSDEGLTNPANISITAGISPFNSGDDV